MNYAKPLILIVEDEEDQRDVFVELLSDTYTIILAKNGQEAIDQFSRYLNRIQLILLDINLPDINGHCVALVAAHADSFSGYAACT